MKCPACQASVPEDAWICPHCDHIIDTSFLRDQNDGDIHEEKTGLLLWNKTVETDEPPDAVILGGVDVPEDEFSVVSGPGAEGDGRTSTFLYYAADSSTRVVHPSAVPVVVNLDRRVARTPYEDHLLSCIDGRRTVREIQRYSGLAPQDVAVSLLTLIDKGAIRVAAATQSPAGDRRRRALSASYEPTQMTQPGDVAQSRGRPAQEPARASASRGLRDDDGMRTEALDLEPRGRRLPRGPVPDDFEDLPSISDFQVISTPDDRPTSTTDPANQAAAPQLQAAPSLGRSKPRTFSDVWAEEEPSSGINAAALIESEVPVSSVEEAPHIEEITEGGAADFPDEVTAALDFAEGRLPKPTRLQDPVPPSIAMPSVTMPRGSAEPVIAPKPLVAQELVELETPSSASPGPTSSVIERLGSHAGQEPRPASGFTRLPNQVSDARLPAVIPVDDLGAPEDIAQTKEIPVPLNAQFLLEVESPLAAPASDAGALGAGRPPAQEVDRRIARPLRAPVPTEPSPDPKGSTTAEAPKVRAPRPDPSADPVDVVRAQKAARLFEQALKDQSAGNLVSARMNMKLALTFDPSNDLYLTAFEELSKNPATKARSMSAVRSQARELYDQATEAERYGNVDRAIELLERAIQQSRRAPFLNRLGVILAMKKRRYAEAQALIEEAIELVPTNPTYERNLQKVLSMAAAREVHAASNSGKRSGLLRGLLGRRK